MKSLNKQQILQMHERLIAETGGLQGVRDDALLDSAIASPFSGFGDFAAFPSLQQKAACLGYGLVKNHPFIDGNKRIGAHAMLVLLAANGVELIYTQQELSDVILRLADDQIGCDELLRWLLEHEKN